MKHQWVITGRDYDTNVGNIWRCSRCGLYRAIDYGDPSRRCEEYSDADGEIIKCNIKKPPRCKPQEDTWDTEKTNQHSQE